MGAQAPILGFIEPTKTGGGGGWRTGAHARQKPVV